MSRQKILNVLGVKLRVLENTKCPECHAHNPNALYSVSDGKFHVVCTNCAHQTVGPDFESALYQFDAMHVLANLDCDSSLIDDL